MSPKFTNPFINTNFAASSYSPTSPLSSPTYYQVANGAATNTGTVVLYNPSSLYGLYYNETVHGPFATGLQANPFTPGLSPLSAVPKPSYAVEDPFKQRFPAMRLPDDPLNWISEDLFNIRVVADRSTEISVALFMMWSVVHAPAALVAIGMSCPGNARRFESKRLQDVKLCLDMLLIMATLSWMATGSISNCCIIIRRCFIRLPEAELKQVSTKGGRGRRASSMFLTSVQQANVLRRLLAP